jgi:hypothetical protein
MNASHWLRESYFKSEGLPLTLFWIYLFYLDLFIYFGIIAALGGALSHWGEHFRTGGSTFTLGGALSHWGEHLRTTKDSPWN